MNLELWLDRGVYFGALLHFQVIGHAHSEAVPARVYWRSDACNEGSSNPAIAGIVGGTYWVRPLRGAELALHITVTEFCGHYGNEIVFGPSFPEPIEIVAEMQQIIRRPSCWVGHLTELLSWAA